MKKKNAIFSKKFLNLQRKKIEDSHGHILRLIRRFAGVCKVILPVISRKKIFCQFFRTEEKRPRAQHGRRFLFEMHT